MVTNNQNYMKNYYQQNKEKIYEQTKASLVRRRIRNMIKRLNNNDYKNVPHAKIELYNIKKNENGIYYQDKSNLANNEINS
jgi:hypothetical protein